MPTNNNEKKVHLTIIKLNQNDQKKTIDPKENMQKNRNVQLIFNQHYQSAKIKVVQRFSQPNHQTELKSPIQKTKSIQFVSNHNKNHEKLLYNAFALRQNQQIQSIKANCSQEQQQKIREHGGQATSIPQKETKISQPQKFKNQQCNFPNCSNANISKLTKPQTQQTNSSDSQQLHQQTPKKNNQQNTQKQIKPQAENSTQKFGKRPRDWQIKEQILVTKKQYEFCDGSIIFEIDPEYELQKLIGSGIYGIVASGKNKLTNLPVAVKRISKLFNNFGDTKRVLREIKVLQFLKHKNIIALQGIMKIQNPDTFNEIYLVMEYMEFDLRRLIQSQMKITEQMAKFIMYQLLVAINFMHSADILHRDLKPQNILMNKKCELKLADMNLARKETYSGNITEYVASRPYRAPQILIGSTIYTKSVDIWSIGCILAELLGKTIIFHGKDYIDQLKRFVAILGKPKIEYFPNIDSTSMESLSKLIVQIPDKEKVQWKYLMPNISDKAADLLDHMLTYDSRARFTAEDCLNHPYLEQYKKAPRAKCMDVFDFSFDKIQLNESKLRSSIYQATLSFNQKKGKIQSKTPVSFSQEDLLKKKVKQN